MAAKRPKGAFLYSNCTVRWQLQKEQSHGAIIQQLEQLHGVYKLRKRGAQRWEFADLYVEPSIRVFALYVDIANHAVRGKSSVVGEEENDFLVVQRHVLPDPLGDLEDPIGRLEHEPFWLTSARKT